VPNILGHSFRLADIYHNPFITPNQSPAHVSIN